MSTFRRLMRAKEERDKGIIWRKHWSPEKKLTVVVIYVALAFTGWMFIYTQFIL